MSADENISSVDFYIARKISRVVDIFGGVVAMKKAGKK
jgi:hypothetical protein